MKMQVVNSLVYKNKNQSGFTLIELLVAIAIIAIVLVGLLLMLTSFLRVRNNNEAEQAVKTEGNYALDRIEFAIRNSITMPDVCCQLSTTPITCNGTNTPTLPNSMTVISAQNATGRANAHVHQRILLQNNRIQIGGVAAGATFNNITTENAIVSQLTFNCQVEQYGSPTQRAFVTVRFLLETSDLTDRDNLSDINRLGQQFERRVAVGNNHTYIRP
jgi:prepilin-type N-terminal cleavage/methylation domain-containing protein